MVRPYDDAPDAEESVSADFAVEREDSISEEVAADAAPQEVPSTDAEAAEADTADGTDAAGQPEAGDASVGAAGADAAEPADREPASGHEARLADEPASAVGVGSAEPIEAAASADVAAAEPADVAESLASAAPASDAAPAAEPLDPIAAAAAAARAEAEKVRAAEQGRPAQPDLAADPVPASPYATAAMPAQPARVHPAALGAVRPAASYGTVEPARSRKSGGGRRGIAVALIVVLLFAAVGAGVYWFFFANKSEPVVSLDRGQRVTLTLTRAQQVLEGLGMEAPDLSQFRYVPTDNLVGPKFENVAVGDVVEQRDGDAVTATRQVTADALFRNKGILLTVPVTITFAYDEAGETWREGDLELGAMTAQPLSAPNAATIVEDLDALLAAYDPAVGTLFAGSAAKTSSRLTSEGGTITVAMAKDESVAEPDAEGKEHQLIKHHNCTAQIVVTWSDTEGWVAKVDRLNDEVTVEDVTAPQPDDGDDQNAEGGGETGPIGQEGGRPEYGLKCSTGDLVELGGTVTGSAGALTFKPDGGLRLTLDGAQRDVWSMTLTLGEGIDANSLVGRHVTVVGTIGSGTLAAEEVTVG